MCEWEGVGGVSNNARLVMLRKVVLKDSERLTILE